jgi:hypothetical protein
MDKIVCRGYDLSLPRWEQFKDDPDTKQAIENGQKSYEETSKDEIARRYPLM